MTVIAGFRCLDGIVICGDTQETAENLSKRHVTKVRVEPPVDRPDELAAAFCGAGEGPFIDMLTRKAWEAAEATSSLDQACNAVETSIKDAYQEYGQIYQLGLCPSVELIYGLKHGGGSRLFAAHGPVINEVYRYCSGGIGYFMVDFLAGRRYRAPDVHQCVILAAYILYQAKEHVVGCGGGSHVAILRPNKRSGMVDPTRVEELTKLLQVVDGQFGPVLLASADLRKLEPTRKGIRDTILDLAKIVNHYREAARTTIQTSDMFGLAYDKEWDDLGFLVPPSNQTVEEDL